MSDMLDTLQKEPKDDIGRSVQEALNIHLPAFQNTLLTEWPRREDSTQLVRRDELKSLLEDLLENYLGSQRVIFAAESETQTSATTNILEPLSHLSSRYQAVLVKECRYSIVGITADADITWKMQTWWASQNSNILWIQTAPEDFSQRPLATDIIALAHVAGIPCFAYFCQRHDQNGRALDKMETFANLVYSVLFQVCQHATQQRDTAELPGIIGSAKEVDGTTRALPAALLLLQELLTLKSTQSCLLVLDGMEILEYSNNAFLEEELRAFLKLLGSNDVYTKALIITEGHSGIILEEVGWENSVDASMGNGSDGFFSIEDLKVVSLSIHN